MTLLGYVVLFGASVIVTLGACALFTNAIEWLGKRLNLSEGAVGSVLAAIGTTLPETSIPIVAIFFGATQDEAEVGLGAILGAPFMLSTLVVPLLALLLLVYARLGKRGRSFLWSCASLRAIRCRTGCRTRSRIASISVSSSRDIRSWCAAIQ